MAWHQVTTPDDPRLSAYRDLPVARQAAPSGRFIAEGEIVVRRLLESDFEVESVLAIEPAAARLREIIPPRVDVYIAAEPTIRGTVGYRFHMGALACGLRRTGPQLSTLASWARPVATIVAGMAIAKPDNVGAIIRTAAAFGADAVLFDQRCADPFSRRVLRVSVGSGFRLPIVQSAELRMLLGQLREEFACDIAAAVTSASSTPLSSFRRAARQVILLGSEGEGLADDVIAECDRQLTIPMREDFDSLNVSMAAGIILYELARDQTGT